MRTEHFHECPECHEDRGCADRDCLVRPERKYGDKQFSYDKLCTKCVEKKCTSAWFMAYNSHNGGRR